MKINLQMNKIKNIIFDLGGVLIDWNPAYVYLEVFNGDRKKMEFVMPHQSQMFFFVW